jgi:predicted membrane protein
VLLILWGINVLLKKKERWGTHVFSDVKQNVTGELFHEASVFGDFKVNVESKNFKGGSVSTVFGGGHIDLSKAGIAEGEHWLRVSGVFGDVTITLPEGCACSVTGNVLFGDLRIFDEKKSGFSSDLYYVSPGYDTARNKLRLSLSQVFGNITVS